MEGLASGDASVTLAFGQCHGTPGASLVYAPPYVALFLLSPTDELSADNADGARGRGLR